MRPDAPSGEAALGVLGGTFDPPHMGHVLLAAAALSLGEVEQVLVAPVWRHPFGKQPHASFETRLRMCRLAFAPLRRVRVEDIERRLGGSGRTVELLEALHRERPDRPLRLLLGADTFAQLDEWAEPERIRHLAPPLVFGRGGFPPPPGCDLRLPAISSTEVRRRLRCGEPMRGLLPVEVERLARRTEAYRSQEAPA